jgi:uncharacterized OB-fold protein
MSAPELLTMTSPDVGMPYEWSIGIYGSKFFQEIRAHQRFVGIRCPQCGKVRVPPRRVCGTCFRELDELVPLPPTGTIIAFTIVNYPFIDPATGLERPVPYTYGYIQLDGADNIFSHIINETDETRIKVGMRVRAVFKPAAEMQGNIQDIRHFEIIEVKHGE